MPDIWKDYPPLADYLKEVDEALVENTRKHPSILRVVKLEAELAEANKKIYRLRQEVDELAEKCNDR